MRGRRRIGIDSEGYLIGKANKTPKTVCVTVCCDDGEAEIFKWSEARDLLFDILNTPSLELVLHHARFDLASFAAMDPELLALIFKAYDEDRIRCTMIREKLLALAKGELADEGDTGAKRNRKFSLAAIVLERFHVDLFGDKSSAKENKDGTYTLSGNKASWRLRYSELDDVPLRDWPEDAKKYALDDPRWNLAVYESQEAELIAGGGSELDGVIPDEMYQTRAAFWLYLMAAWGIRTDPVAVNALSAKLEAEWARINTVVRAGDVLKPQMKKGEMVWTKNMTAIRSRVVSAFGGLENLPLSAWTPGGKDGKGKKEVSTSGETLLACVNRPCLDWIEERERAVVELRAKEALPPLSEEALTSLAKTLCRSAADEFYPPAEPFVDTQGGAPLPREEHVETRAAVADRVFNQIILDALSERGNTEKLLKTYVPMLFDGTQRPICTNTNELVATGRTSCVAKGTLIEVVRNTSEKPFGVPIEDVKVGDLVYAFDDQGSLTVKPVTKAWKTGHRKVIRIHWIASGRHGGKGYVDLTEDHYVRCLGGWRASGDLLVGDRVVALRRGLRNGYWQLYATGQREYREHRFLFSMLHPGENPDHVHHIDNDKLNNDPSNLVGMTEEDHCRHHNTGVVKTPTQRAAISARMTKSWVVNRANHERASANSRIKIDKTVVEDALWQCCGHVTETASLLGVDFSVLQRLLKLHDINASDIAKEFTGHGERIDAEFVQKHRAICEASDRPPFKRLLTTIGLNWYGWRSAQEKFGHVPYNHEIVAIEHLPDEVDVYDLTVEDAHNFIANEICVHNCWDPNLQNPPRKGGVRECFVPRRGKLFAFCDYSFIELVTLAQVCLWKFGYSVLADAINDKKDPHLVMAATMLGITYEEIYARRKEAIIKIARQGAKAINFGRPGGLGDDKFVEYAYATYGVRMSKTEARRYKEMWFETYPEMREYLAWFGSLSMGDREFTIIQLPSGRVRGGCRYTSGANSMFQGLAADGIKRAGWNVSKECYLPDPYFDGSGPTDLLGCRIVAMLHDELILEVPEERAHEATLRLSERMVSGMREVVPDVLVGTESALARRWYKGAEPVFVDGRLVPWQPKEQAVEVHELSPEALTWAHEYLGMAT